MRKNWEPSIYIKKNELLPNEKYIYPTTYVVNFQNAKILEKYLPIYIKGRLADLGCGKVPLYGFYKDYVDEWIGLDWNNRSYKNLKIIEQDLSKKLPFNKSSFDTILLTEVLEHIQNPDKLLSEIYRVLKKGGHVIITVPFLYFIHEEPHDYFRYTKYALKKLTQQAGFSVVLIEEKGGILEIMADLFSALIYKIPIFGKSLCLLTQKIYILFLKAPQFKNISNSSKERFPTGYILVLTKK